MTVTRPGPSSIPAGEYPGGVIVHIYAVPDGVLLSTSHLRRGDDLEADARRAAAQVGALRPSDGAVCMVGYDGDTGVRFTQHDWLRWIGG